MFDSIPFDLYVSGSIFMAFPALKNCSFVGLVETDRLSLFSACSADKDSSLPRLLFLGGSNTDFSIKASVFSSRLIEHFNVLSYEPRGLGRSASPAGDWIMRGLCLGCHCPSLMPLVGTRLSWSASLFGGMTALEVAIRFPERVTSLCLTAAASGGEGGSSYPIHDFLNLEPRDKAIAALSVHE